MHLIQIPPDAVINGESPLEKMWGEIAPLLERAIEHSDGTATVQSTVNSITAKRKQLWVVVDDNKQLTAAGITKLEVLESGLKQATITLLGGEEGSLKDLLDLRSELESWAKVEGCSRVHIMARKGWAKFLPDYKLARYVMSKDI